MNALKIHTEDGDAIIMMQHITHMRTITENKTTIYLQDRDYVTIDCGLEYILDKIKSNVHTCIIQL